MKPAILIALMTLVVGLTLAPTLAFAVEAKKDKPGEVTLPNPLVNKDTKANLTIQQIIGSGIRVSLGIVGSVALVMFFYGGYLWLISGGSSDKIKKGKETLIWATIGLVVIFGSGILVRTVINALQAAG